MKITLMRKTGLCPYGISLKWQSPLIECFYFPSQIKLLHKETFCRYGCYSWELNQTWRWIPPVKTVYAITSTQRIETGSVAFNPHTSSDDGMGHFGHQNDSWLAGNEWNSCTTTSASTASLRTSSVDFNTKYRSSTQRNVPALETAVWGYHCDDRVVWHLHQPISLTRFFFSAQYGQWWKKGKLWKSHYITVHGFNSFQNVGSGWRRNYISLVTLPAKSVLRQV